MSGFDAAWLALREPCDHAARNAALAARFVGSLGAGPSLIDLGCGTGANLRYLAPRIPGAQRWLCVDHDPALLDEARSALRGWAHRPGWSSRDQGGDLVLARGEGDVVVRFAGGDLARDGLPDVPQGAGVSGSALLDLTSALWLDGLAARCRGVALLMALSVDGRLTLEPALDEDEDVRRLFLAHQRRDKGFGPALGPDAAGYLAERLEAQGSEVTLAPADWRLGSEDGALIRATLDGIVEAARQVAPDRRLDRWCAMRRRDLACGDLRLTVGHVDLLALPV